MHKPGGVNMHYCTRSLLARISGTIMTQKGPIWCEQPGYFRCWQFSNKVRTPCRPIPLGVCLGVCRLKCPQDPSAHTNLTRDKIFTIWNRRHVHQRICQGLLQDLWKNQNVNLDAKLLSFARPSKGCVWRTVGRISLWICLVNFIDTKQNCSTRTSRPVHRRCLSTILL
jgi:hypothetical protein